MIDMLKAKREELQARGVKGFTLMEMLIVIAIIAVLIAIAIPVFSTQLERSREATDLANIRSAYGTAVSEWITKNAGSSADSAATVTATVPVTQTVAKWQSQNDEEVAYISSDISVAGNSTAGAQKIPVTAKTSGSYTITVDKTGAVKVE